jgi:single-strand DNA-binding protein
MARLNKFLFIGNLTRDTELRYTAGDKAVATISLAVTDEWRDVKGNKQEKTNYFRISAWDALGENAQKYLGKGSAIYVEGRIENSEYTKDGQTEKTYVTNYIAENIQYLLTKPPAGAQTDGSEGEAA